MRAGQRSRATPDAPHADRFGRAGALNLVLEVPPERLDALPVLGRALAAPGHWRDANLAALPWRMHRELTTCDDAAALALEGLALELLAGVARLAHAHPRWHARDERGVAALRGGPPPGLARARELLHAHADDRALRIAALAAAANVHPVHLARAFRAHYGRTPGAYLRALRLHRAAEALAAGSAPLSQVALDAGFADQSHFTRAFRAAFGTTPGRWRADAPSVP